MADVSFTKKTWADGSSGGTPITASELNRMEQGIKDCADGVNGLGDSISPMITRGGSYTITVEGGTIAEVEIKFSKPFDTVPIVGAWLMGNMAKDYEHVQVSANDRTTKGFTLMVLNNTSRSYGISMGWIAFTL